MDPIRNPYAPGAGTPPPELVGRDEIRESARICIGANQNRSPTKNMVLVGLRGVGKTVLLDLIREEAEASGSYALRIEAPENRSLPPRWCLNACCIVEGIISLFTQGVRTDMSVEATSRGNMCEMSDLLGSHRATSSFYLKGMERGRMILPLSRRAESVLESTRQTRGQLKGTIKEENIEEFEKT